MRGGGPCVAYMAGGACMAGSVHGGGVHSRGLVWLGGCCVTGETTTAVDGTHPTGMHSCLIVYLDRT